MHLLVLPIVLFVCFSLLQSRQDFVRFRKLHHERMSTHSFLSNMLPPLVFEGLKREDATLIAHERQEANGTQQQSQQRELLLIGMRQQAACLVLYR